MPSKDLCIKYVSDSMVMYHAYQVPYFKARIHLYASFIAPKYGDHLLAYNLLFQ